MREYLTFDDILIAPKFSSIDSRSQIDLSTYLGNLKLNVPVLSANMDTVTESKMATAMAFNGGLGVLHRFCSVEDNVKMFNDCGFINCAISVGIGPKEIDRVLKLRDQGASTFVLDVAHAAQEQAAAQFNIMKLHCPDANIIVGNFATPDSISEFYARVNDEPTAVKIGIGPGSACTTRIKTGIGIPQLSAIMNCSKIYNGVDPHIIADGGMKNSGDIAKALAAGADSVMLGGMLSGTEETPGEIITKRALVGDPHHPQEMNTHYKKYSGSASKESYDKQGKTSSWRTAEGESFLVAYKGSVSSVLQDISAGLKSSFAYVGAKNLKEFKKKATFIKITNAGKQESIAHGDK